MKKILFLLLIILLFYMKINFVVSAEAVEQYCGVDGPRGTYTYDINSFGIVGQNLVIDGWGLLNDDSGFEKIHNIQPTFTLELIGTDRSKNKKEEWKRGPYINSKATYSYEHADACYAAVDDYSRVFWYRDTSCSYGLLFYDKLSCKDRSSMGLCPDNFLYLDLDFRFEIPLSVIDELGMMGAERVYFRLTMSVPGGEKKVFGNDIDTIARSEEFYISVQDIAVSSGGFEGTSIRGVGGAVNQVTVTVTTGKAQSKSSLGQTPYYYQSKNSPILVGGSGAGSVYYMQKENYTVVNSTLMTAAGENNTTAKLPDMRMYEVKIKRFCNGSTCYVDSGGHGYVLDNYGAANYEAYVPSAWSIPYCNTDDPTYIEINPQSCHIDPRCNPVTDECPEVCCKDICILTEGNEDTNFCSKICYPDAPSPDECDYDDALSQYCCLYPEDDELCDELIKPQKESNVRSATCSRNKSVEEEYKYPRVPTIDDMGHDMVDNQACYISCQEKVIVKFEREPYVKAGMGFDYPVAINGSRICGAVYKNEEWVEKMNTAVEKANEYYEKMVDYLEEANDEADDCRNKENEQYVIDAYTDHGTGRTGCSHCKKSCKTSCKKCGNDHNYTSFNTYAFLNIDKSFDNINTIDKNPVLSNNYFAFNNNYYLLAQDDDPPPCTCTTTHCSKHCSRKVCDYYVCSKSGDTWDSAQSSINSELSSAKSYKQLHDKQMDIIKQLEKDRNICDNWVTDNKYMKSSQTKITTTLSTQPNYKKTDDDYDDINNSFARNREHTTESYDVSYCTEGKHGVKKSSYNKFKTGYFDDDKYCVKTNSKVEKYDDVWVDESTRDLEYEFSNYYYVQRYTGTYNTSGGSGYDPDGRYYYTDFFDYTGLYNFYLILKNIGPNLKNSGNKEWAIDRLNCDYNLTNWIFPPRGDPQYELYGSTTFRYRSISLKDPFPNRKPGSNWIKKEYIIEEFEEKPWHINLTSAMRQDIRMYNVDLNFNYASFNINDPYRSNLITISQNNLIRINQ